MVTHSNQTLSERPILVGHTPLLEKYLEDKVAFVAKCNYTSLTNSFSE